MGIKNKISFSCIFIFLGYEVFFCFAISAIFRLGNERTPAWGYGIATILSLIIWLLFFCVNLYGYFVQGKRDFSLRSFFTGGSEAVSDEKRKAMYPPVHPALTKKVPIGLVFGKQNGKYVCRDVDEDGHIFVIGGSGSGKSSCLVIPTLLVKKDTTVFAIDIKGELHNHTVRHDDAKTKIFDPEDRSRYGYNPLYRLSGTPNRQEIYETMRLIAFSLVPIPADIKDPFWKKSARSLFIGLLIYFFRQGVTNFVDIIDRIMSKPIKEVIDDAMERCISYDIEYKFLVEFSNMAETTLSGIYMELSNHITIFAADEDIRYAFRDNYLTVSPSDLENRINVFIAIKEEKLSAYYDVLQLIINQMLSELERRSENSHRVLFIVDELARIVSAGRIEHLLDAARTLRSRKVTLFLVTQSMEGLMSAFSENEVTDLKDNCSYTVVLSAHSNKTQKMVANWCGTYREKRKTWKGGFLSCEQQYTYEEKDIVTPGELMQLQNQGELILISPYGYNRIRKAPYYSDKILRLFWEDVRQYNDYLEEEEKT